MTPYELSLLQAGENLDALMNLDPRGYGVCRALYPAARALAGEPLSLHAARYLLDNVQPGQFCYVMTGFVLLPHGCPETDGMISSMLLCRLLTGMCGAAPVLICPEDCREPARAMAAAAGLHLYEGEDALERARMLPASAAFVSFPKEREAAEERIRWLMETARPFAAVAIELPGANEKGVYHNAVGLDVSALEARTDLFLQKLSGIGVPTVAIGDLGNEAGLAALRPHLYKAIPYTAEGECRCGCGGGIAAATAADRVLTAVTSDWGCLAMMSAMAFLREQPDWLPDSRLYGRVLDAGCRAGLIDMGGWQIPAVDGFGEELLLPVADLMKETCRNILKIRQSGSCGHWFDGMLQKKYFG